MTTRETIHMSLRDMGAKVINDFSMNHPEVKMNQAEWAGLKEAILKRCKLVSRDIELFDLTPNDAHKAMEIACKEDEKFFASMRPAARVPA